MERQALRLPESADPLQTYENGRPLGDTRFLDFGPGIQSTLIGDDFVRITADGGETPWDAVVDNSQTTNEKDRIFAGIGEALTYLSVTVGLTSVAVFVRSTATTYTETANFASPAKVHLYGGRGDFANPSTPSGTAPNVKWDWAGWRPSSQIMLHVENFEQFEPGNGASGGAFTSFPVSFFQATNCYVIFSHTGATAAFCTDGMFVRSTFRFLPGSGTTTQRICSDKGTYIQCDGEQAPSSSGTLTLVPATNELLMTACRWQAATSGTHFLTLATASNVELTYVKNRQPTSTPTGFITINVAGGSRNRLVLVNETNGSNDMQWLVSAASAFESLDFFGQARVTVTGAHDWLSVTGSIQTFWDITGPAVVNGSTANAGFLILRGQGISGSVSGDGLTSTATRVQFIAASFCAIQEAFDATGAAAGNSPYSFDASSNNNVLVLAGQSTFGTAGTDAGTGNRVLPETVLTAGHVIEDEGVGLAQQPNLNFVGAGVTVTDSAPDTIVTIPGGGSGVDVEEEGVAEGTAAIINFTGAGVDVTFAAGTATVDIPGGGAGSGGVLHSRSTRTAGSYILNSTSWANLDTGLDIVLAAGEGDWVEVGFNALWGNEAVSAYIDVVTVVSAAPVNSLGLDAAAPTGITVPSPVGWWSVSTANYQPFGSSLIYQLAAGDISANTVTLRLRYRTNTAANKTLYADTDNRFSFWARNHRGSGAGHAIEDEGVALTQQGIMDFVGAGVTATDAGGKTVVTIPGGGGGGGDEPSAADWMGF